MELSERKNNLHKSCARHGLVYEKMKTSQNNCVNQIKRFLERETEQIMQEVYRRELQEMAYIAEYGY